MYISIDDMKLMISGLHNTNEDTWKKISDKNGWYKFYDEFKSLEHTYNEYYIIRGQISESLVNAWIYANKHIVSEFTDVGTIKLVDTNYKSSSGNSLADGIKLSADGTLYIISSKVKNSLLGFTESDISNLVTISNKIKENHSDKIKRIHYIVVVNEDWSTVAKKRINELVLSVNDVQMTTILLDEINEPDENFNKKHEYKYMNACCRELYSFIHDYNYQFPNSKNIFPNRLNLSTIQSIKRDEIVYKFNISDEILFNADCRSGKTLTSLSVSNELGCMNDGKVILFFGDFPGNNDQMIAKIKAYHPNINCGIVEPKGEDKFFYNPNKINIALLSAQMVFKNDEYKEIDIKDCVKELINMNVSFMIIDEAHYGIGSDLQSFFTSNFKCKKLYLTGTADVYHLKNMETVTLNDNDIYYVMANDSESYLDKNKHKRSIRHLLNFSIEDFDVAKLEATLCTDDMKNFSIDEIRKARLKSFEELVSQLKNALDIRDNREIINSFYKFSRTGKGILWKEKFDFINNKTFLMLVQNRNSQIIWSNVIDEYNKNKGSELVKYLIINSEVTPGKKAIELANDFLQINFDGLKIILVVKQCLVGCDFNNLDAVINWTYKTNDISLMKQQGLNRSKTPIGENGNPCSTYYTPYQHELYKIIQQDVYNMTHNGNYPVSEEIAEKISVSSIVYGIFQPHDSIENYSEIYNKMLRVVSDCASISIFDVNRYKIKAYLNDTKYNVIDLDINNVGFKLPYIIDRETQELILDSKGNPIPYSEAYIDDRGKIYSFDDVKKKHKENSVVKIATGKIISNPKFKKSIDDKKISKIATDLSKEKEYKNKVKQQIVFTYTLNAFMAYTMCYILFNSEKDVVEVPTCEILMNMINKDKELFDWFFSNETYKKVFKNMQNILSFLDEVYGINSIDKIISEWYQNIIQNKYIRMWVMNNKVYKKKFGEVLTPDYLVVDMLNTIPDEIFKDKNKTFIDNSYGTGNFLIKIIDKCLKLQEDDFCTTEERFEWIIKNRIYGVELQERNVRLSLYRHIYEDDKDINKLFNPILNHKNWWIESGHCVCQDALTFDYWNGQKFDVVVGNPPYNMPRKNHLDGSDILWDKFVFKAFDILKDDGHLVYIHPIGWRQYESKTGLWDLMTSKNITFIKNITEQECKKIFDDVEQRIDYYHLENKPYEYKTIVNDNYGNIFECDLSQHKFLTSESFELILKYLAKDGEETTKIIKPRKIKDKNGNIPLIDAVTVDENNIRYETTLIDNGANIVKVIFPENGRKGRFKDFEGKYSVGQYCFAIECDKNDIDGFFDYCKSDEMNNIIEALRWSVLHCKYQVFSLFRKNWWKKDNIDGIE